MSAKTKYALSASDGVMFRLEYDDTGTLTQVSATARLGDKDRAKKVNPKQFRNKTVQAFDTNGGRLVLLKFGEDGLDGLPEVTTKDFRKDKTVEVMDLQSGLILKIYYDLDGGLRFVEPDMTALAGGPPANDYGMGGGAGGLPATRGKRINAADFINKTVMAIDTTGGVLYTVKFNQHGLNGIPQVSYRKVDDNFDFNNPNYIEVEARDPLDKDNKEAIRAFEEARKQVDRMIGLTDAKEKMQQVLANFKARKVRSRLGLKSTPPSLHLAFVGNPGTGKTTYARYYATLLRAAGILDKGHVVEVDRSKLVAGFIGQTEDKTRKVIDSARGGVLIIDEFYSLGVKGSGAGGEGEYGQRALEVLLKVMEDDRDDIVIILTGYTKEMMDAIESNPGLKRRLAKIIEFPDYSAEELNQIFNLFAEDMGMTLDTQARKMVTDIIKDGVRKKDRHFGNAGSVRNLIEEIQQRSDSRIEAAGLWDKAAQELDKKGKISAELEKQLKTVTVADVKGLSLVGKPQSLEDDGELGIGFGRRLKKLDISNDDEPTARTKAAKKRQMKPGGMG